MHVDENSMKAVVDSQDLPAEGVSRFALNLGTQKQLNIPESGGCDIDEPLAQLRQARKLRFNLRHGRLR